MESDVFSQIKSFVEEQRFKYDFELERNTKVWYDLGIYGDDAMEFIIAFGKKFNVDVSKFMLADYFRGEGDETIETLINLFRRKNKTEYKIITLGDLECAVIAGKLDDSVIENK